MINVKPTGQALARSRQTILGVSVDHYENFPVASWLCPAALRAPVEAIYHFARTADDLADEGDVSEGDRLAALCRYRWQLAQTLAGSRCVQDGPWGQVFIRLGHAITSHHLPGEPLHALLNAFEQDVRSPSYPDRDHLINYCEQSANPVGRLLMHLYGIHEPLALAQSDAICTSLQLINFWQDLGQDLRRGRSYVPAADMRQHGVLQAELNQLSDTVRTRAMVAELVAWAHSLMLQGAPLALRVPGRAGWELRLVVQGGLRVVERIRAMDFRVLQHRVRLRRRDLPAMCWGALTMRAKSDAP